MSLGSTKQSLLTVVEVSVGQGHGELRGVGRGPSRLYSKTSVPGLTSVMAELDIKRP